MGTKIEDCRKAKITREPRWQRENSTVGMKMEDSRKAKITGWRKREGEREREREEREQER